MGLKLAEEISSPEGEHTFNSGLDHSSFHFNPKTIDPADY
jgi:hypothetical protein